MFLLVGCSIIKNTEPLETATTDPQETAAISSAIATSEIVNNIDGEIPMSLTGALGIKKAI